jgi:hypothetical protein
LQYQTEISNFLNSAEAKWGVNSPQPFSRFVGIVDNDYQSLLNSKNYWPEFEETIGITLSFVIAHEFGHHIFEHQAVDLTQQRRNEDEADDFAIRVNWMIGNNPLLALDYFMLFTQVEGQIISAGRTHTASACRLEKFMDAGIKFTRSEPLGQRLINGNPKFQEYLQKIQEGQRRLKEMCEKGEAMPSSGTPFLK